MFLTSNPDEPQTRLSFSTAMWRRYWVDKGLRAKYDERIRSGGLFRLVCALSFLSIACPMILMFSPYLVEAWIFE